VRKKVCRVFAASAKKISCTSRASPSPHIASHGWESMSSPKTLRTSKTHPSTFPSFWIPPFLSCLDPFPPAVFLDCLASCNGPPAPHPNKAFSSLPFTSSHDDTATHNFCPYNCGSLSSKPAFSHPCPHASLPLLHLLLFHPTLLMLHHKSTAFALAPTTCPVPSPPVGHQSGCAHKTRQSFTQSFTVCVKQACAPAPTFA
jgi:hypothetical protein